MMNTKKEMIFNEFIDFAVPLTGLFKKKRNPKHVEYFRNFEDLDEMLEDFVIAQSLGGDSFRIGKKCIFFKESSKVFWVDDIASAIYREREDESGKDAIINILFKDGSEKRLCVINDSNLKKAAQDIFVVLEALNIKTIYKN